MKNPPNEYALPSLYSIHEVMIDRSESEPRVRLLSETGATLMEFRASLEESSRSLDGKIERLRFKKFDFIGTGTRVFNDELVGGAKEVDALVPKEEERIADLISPPVQTTFPGCAPRERTYTTKRAPHGTPVKPTRRTVALFRRLVRKYRKGDTKPLRELVKNAHVGARTIFLVAEGRDSIGSTTMKRVSSYARTPYFVNLLGK